MRAPIKCHKCSNTYLPGEYPFCPHGLPAEHRPFVPYFDISLGADITSNYQRNKVAKGLHADMRDQPSKGDISARKDRCNEASRRG
jgi:hypothetical protein